MTAFQKGAISFCLICIFFWFFTWSGSTVTIVYPDNCVFTIDKNFSQSMQIEIRSFVDNAYKKNKNPSNLLFDIESNFSSIKSIIIDMQNPDALYFLIQTYQPIFLVNNEYVVCQLGKIFPKTIFSQDLVTSLENIVFDETLVPEKIDRLMDFVKNLPSPILKDFSIRWIDKHLIWLHQKRELGLSLLVGYDYVPTLQDVAQCRKLRGLIIGNLSKDKRSDFYKSQMTWVCDLRFAQQIVLFSTNKGV